MRRPIRSLVVAALLTAVALAASGCASDSPEATTIQSTQQPDGSSTQSAQEPANIEQEIAATESPQVDPLCFVGGEDCPVEINGNTIRGRHLVANGIRDFEQLPDGRIVSLATDQRTKVWDVDNPNGDVLVLEEPFSPDAPQFGLTQYNNVTVLRDGTLIVGSLGSKIAGGINTATLWDLTNPATPLAAFQGPVDDEGIDSIVELDNGLLAFGGDRVQIWDRNDPSGPLLEYPAERTGPQDFENDLLAWDGQLLIVNEGDIYVWSPPDQQEPQLLRSHDDIVHFNPFLDHPTLTGESRLALTQNGNFTYYDLNTPANSAVRVGPILDTPGATAVATLTNDRLAIGTSIGVVAVVDMVSGSRTEIGQHDTTVSAILALADGRIVSGDNDGVIRIWPAP